MSQSAKSLAKAALLSEAQAQLKKGAVIKAMQIYYDLHEQDPTSTETLTQLAAITLHLELSDQAIINLQKLIVLEPSNSVFYDQLASVYGRLGDWTQACDVYYGLILRRPGLPEAHFNLGYNLRQAGRFEEAIESYKRALNKGISDPEEVHLNIAVILSDHLRREDEAEQHLREALEINAQYLPALYNLANLYEDRGDGTRSAELFEQILSISPDNAKVLSRLIALQDEGEAQERMLEKLAIAGRSRNLSLSDRIDTFYALGSTHDARGEYDKAYQCYAAANQLNATEMKPYDKAASEKLIERIIDEVSKGWTRSNTRDGVEAPIFVCGMFRSGSTLVEQILGSHRDITAGGERDFFVRELNARKSPYPESLSQTKKTALHEMAEKYIEQSAKLFPESRHLTDKRPDNFLYLGVLKTLFPKSKIVYTVRQPLDNCLSVYFVRLGQAMNYAVNLDDIAHYYDQQLRLLKHWQTLFGDAIHIVDYDELIRNPRRQVENVLQYIGVNWDDNCLNFHKLSNTVKTASVWQVRQPLYDTSSGRWQNYRNHLGALIERYGDSTARRGDE
jgi:tetratricopeptide (TPR) repeat protein